MNNTFEFEGNYNDTISKPLDYTSNTQPDPYMAQIVPSLSTTLYGQARIQFVRKVYSILSIQLLITAAMTIASMYSETFYQFQIKTQWLMWVCLALMIVSQIVVLCLPAGRKMPLNFIFLFLFTLCQSYMVSYACSYTAQTSGKYIVFMAAIMTLGITTAATVFAFISRQDFTVKWGLVVVILCAMLFMGIFSIFWYSRFLYILYCTLGVLLFGIYLIIDTQMILGGKRMQFSIDDYVAAAMLLYIDIIQIFLYILAMLKK